MNYVGIDLGTSGVKILLTDEKGRILQEVTETYDVLRLEKGYSEQNPEDWFNAVMRGLKKLKTPNVAGISFGGQMHGLVIIDRNGQVIRPCILWNDGRCGEETDYLNEIFGKEKLAQYTANIAFAGFTAPKILWVKKHEPENFSRIYKIMLPKDYLVYRLSGVIVTDFSDASGTLLLDVKNKRWSKDMLAVCGINEAQLPELHESCDKVGVLKREISEELCWNGETAVIAGAGDNAAAAIGTGTVSDGECNISLGTSGTLFIARDVFTLPVNNALHSFCHANGKYHLMGCILSAASANKWWIEDILGADYNLPYKAEAKLGKNDVFFLPYLNGERCPHNDVDARGVFAGISAVTVKEDMSLAVLEGVAFALRDCLEIAKRNGINIKSSTVCGGGAKSGLWREIIANVLNLELSIVETEQGPAYGAAILAMTACGEFVNIEEAVSATVIKKTVAVPDSALVLAYNKKYEKYKKLYPALKKWFN